LLNNVGIVIQQACNCRSHRLFIIHHQNHRTAMHALSLHSPFAPQLANRPTRMKHHAAVSMR
jgi:hypothetical protein